MKYLIIGLLFIVLSVATLGCSCKEKKSKNTLATKIDNDYLNDKFFAKTALMGGRVLVFFDDDKVKFIVNDKRLYGYNGTYTIEDEGGKQFIKISIFEKLGDELIPNSIPEKEHKFEFISPTELQEVGTNTVLELIEMENEE